MFYKTLIISTLQILLAISCAAQECIITGKVTDSETNETLPGASIVIQGTTTGSSTDFDGYFEIKNLKPGKYTLQVQFISYKTLTLQNIIVTPDKKTELNIKLLPESQFLEAVKIEATVIREREAITLLEQKKAGEIIQQIGAQELSRKGVNDVATALTKTTGITKTEGNNNIYVRGLGDRYNSTSYNGLPIPSNNPEKKNIALDIFKTDIISFISIDKVYNNRIYGDFAGGNVDISAKEFIEDEAYIKIETGTSINTAAIDEKMFPLKHGPSYLGLNTSNPPATLENFAFENGLDPVYLKPYGLNFSVSQGRQHIFNKNDGNKKSISYFSTLNFENDFSTKEGVAFGAVNSSGIPHKSFKMKTFSYNTNTTGMLNVVFKANNKNKLFYNLLFINSSENANEQYKGTIIDIADNDNGYLNRRSFEKNTIIINQILGKHELNNKTDFNWGLSYNTISNDVPDRIQNTFRMVNGTYFFGQNQITDNHRYFHYLKEKELAGNAALSYKFINTSSSSYKLKLTLGTTARHKTRTFNATQFNFRIASSQRETPVDPDNLSAFFNQENLDNNFFRIETFRGNYQVPFALDPQVYGGTQIIQGGYLTTEYKPTNKFLLIIGLRGEYIYQEVEWNTQLDPSDKSDDIELIPFLPSITTKYEINNKQNLRFGASKTYTLPQFKERAKFIYEEVTQVKLGNPDLYQSDNYNADLKWELFPKPGEIISLAAFGKYILNPINEFAITSATNDISFINTGNWGYVAGLEFEIRKDLFSKPKAKLQAGFNASFMKTEQELNSEKVKEETIYMINFTHEKARFTGASDLLINSDITYSTNWNEKKNNVMFTLTYSYFSDRIYAIGTNNRGNIIESPFHMLDFIVKSEFHKFQAGISFKNLLNPLIETYQANADQDVLVLSYKKGRAIGFSISYKF